MKSPRISEDVLPVGEFKTHASSVLRKLQKNHRPVVITQNGRPAGVLISPRDYDAMAETAAFRAAVLQGLQETADGRFFEDEDLDADVARILGPDV